MNALLACMCVHHAVPVGATRGGVGTPGTGVTNGCKHPHESLGLNLGPSQEQEVFLTNELPLQLSGLFSLYH